MINRANLFAGLGDILCEMCCYYVIAGIFILSLENWGIPLFWLLLPVLLSLALYGILLQKSRSFPFLTGITVAQILLWTLVWCLISSTPIRFGYVFLMLVGAGIAVGRALNVAMHTVLVHNHLVHMDVLLIVTCAVLLIRSSATGKNISSQTGLLFIVVFLIEMAGAIGLRMTEGGTSDSKNALQASILSLGSAGVVFLIIMLVSRLFSKSASFTASVLQWIATALKTIGKSIENMVKYLASLIKIREEYDVVPVEGMPSVAGVETGEAIDVSGVNSTVVAIVLGIFIAVAIILACLLLRKKKISRVQEKIAPAAVYSVQHENGFLARLWKKIWSGICFRWKCYKYRNTLPGLFLYMERMGRKKKMAREEGETIRHYIERVDKKNLLSDFAMAIDKMCYAGMSEEVSLKNCSRIRSAIRKNFSLL